MVIDLDCCKLEIFLKEKLDSEAVEKYRVRKEEPADEVFSQQLLNLVIMDKK